MVVVFVKTNFLPCSQGTNIKNPVPDYEYNYFDFLQVHLIEGIGH